MPIFLKGFVTEQCYVNFQKHVLIYLVVIN